MNEIKLHPKGLVLPKKKLVSRNFSYKKYAKAYGSLMMLPPDIDFEVLPPREVRDQNGEGGFDACVVYSIAAIVEPIKEMDIEPGYNFGRGKQIAGGDYHSFGLDPIAGLKSFINYGTLSTSISPYSFKKNGRDFCANPANWGAKEDNLASISKMKSFLEIEKNLNGDRFDSIRAVLWNRHEWNKSNAIKKPGIVAGAYWSGDWTNPPGGVVPKKVINEGRTPHQFAVIGQKMINGEPYIEAHNSLGKSSGNQGFQYFPREIVNDRFLFQFTMTNISPDELKQNIWSSLQQLADWFIKLLK